MTHKIIRFSDTGFTPVTPDYIAADKLEPGVFAFFKDRVNELLLNHYHPEIRYQLKCYEAEIDHDCIVYHVDELFEQDCESTVEHEYKRNVDEIFIPAESVSNLSNVREVKNIFSV